MELVKKYKQKEEENGIAYKVYLVVRTIYKTTVSQQRVFSSHMTAQIIYFIFERKEEREIHIVV